MESLLPLLIASVVAFLRSEFGSTSPAQFQMTTSYDALPGGSASGGFWSAETASASSDWTVTPTPISFHQAEMNSALWLYVVDDDGTTIFRLIGLPSWSSRAPLASSL